MHIPALRRYIHGFTIVELLIVMCVIGILAVITFVAYNGAVTNGQNSKIDTDLNVLKKTILQAQTMTGRTLRTITGSNSTAWGCEQKPNGTNLATLDHNTDVCWTTYKSALTAIATAAGTTLPVLADPWGQPYFIDENEGEWAAPNNCVRDTIGAYARPLVSLSYATTRTISIPNFSPQC